MKLILLRNVNATSNGAHAVIQRSRQAVRRRSNRILMTTMGESSVRRPTPETSPTKASSNRNDGRAAIARESFKIASFYKDLDVGPRERYINTAAHIECT